MTDVFYGSELKIYKISSVDELKESQFTNSQQLLNLIGSVAHEVYATMRSRNSSLPALTARLLSKSLRISFKQEDSGNYRISYLLLRFREVPIKRQIFVFLQPVVRVPTNSYSTVLLVRASVAQLASAFIRWCGAALGRSSLVAPVHMRTSFCMALLDRVFDTNNIERLKALGDVSMEFKVNSIDNGLKNIKVKFDNKNVLKVLDNVDQFSQAKSVTSLLLSTLRDNTHIDFKRLDIDQIMVSDGFIIKCEKPASVHFYQEGMPLILEGEGVGESGCTVYDVVCDIADEVLSERS